MREIKFRGKRLDNNEWIYGNISSIAFIGDNDLSGNDFSEIAIDILAIENEGARFIVIPETVGQYTGLKDTEEVKIYEGDIVKWCGSFKETDGTIKNCESIYTIKWVDGAFYQVDELYTPEYEILSDVIAVLDDDETYEVIGNIYDNPELLESEE